MRKVKTFYLEIKQVLFPKSELSENLEGTHPLTIWKVRGKIKQLYCMWYKHWKFCFLVSLTLIITFKQYITYSLLGKTFNHFYKTSPSVFML